MIRMMLVFLPYDYDGFDNDWDDDDDYDGFDDDYDDDDRDGFNDDRDDDDGFYDDKMVMMTRMMTTLKPISRI